MSVRETDHANGALCLSKLPLFRTNLGAPPSQQSFAKCEVSMQQMCCVMSIRGPQAVHLSGYILTGPQLRSRESWQASAAAASPAGRLWRPDQALAVFDAPWKHPPAACSPLRAPGCCCLPWQLPQSWKACSGKHQMPLSHACASYIHHRKLHVKAATRATPSKGWGTSAVSDGIAR